MAEISLVCVCAGGGGVNVQCTGPGNCGFRYCPAQTCTRVSFFIYYDRSENCVHFYVLIFHPLIANGGYWSGSIPMHHAGADPYDPHPPFTHQYSSTICQNPTFHAISLGCKMLHLGLLTKLGKPSYFLFFFGPRTVTPPPPPKYLDLRMV